MNIPHPDQNKFAATLRKNVLAMYERLEEDLRNGRISQYRITNAYTDSHGTSILDVQLNLCLPVTSLLITAKVCGNES